MTADDPERALLAERILAEQEERRRLAELIHDGPVQQLGCDRADARCRARRSRRPARRSRASDVVSRSLTLARDAARDLRAALRRSRAPRAPRARLRGRSRRVGATISLATTSRSSSTSKHAVGARRERRHRPLPDPPRGDRAGGEARHAVAHRDLAPSTRPAASSSSSPTMDRRSAALPCSKRSPTGRRR